MLIAKEKEKREKIEARLKKLRYRLYQAEIAFVSHDRERLKDIAKRIGIVSKRIGELLTEKKKTRRIKREKRVKAIRVGRKR